VLRNTSAAQLDNRLNTQSYAVQWMPTTGEFGLWNGSIIFTPDLFGPGITVNEVDWRMMSLDAGVKSKGLSVGGE
jgi:hypothetical protein